MIAGPALQPGSNGGEHAVGFVHHIPGREAQHGEAASAEIVVAGRVVALCTIALVAEAVDLDDEAGMKTREIDDVAADPYLLAEVVAIGAQAIEQAPEADFGGGGAGAQFLDERSRRGAPPPNLPREGGGAGRWM